MDFTAALVVSLMTINEPTALNQRIIYGLIAI